MLKKLKINNIIYLIVILFIIWFFIFRSKEISVTYDSVNVTSETVNYNYQTSSGAFTKKAKLRNELDEAYSSLSLSNAVSPTTLYEGTSIDEEDANSEERYRENIYYRVDTKSFDKLVDAITKDIESLNGTIKVNNQNSNKKVVYDKELYPRFQTIEFTVDNAETNLEKIKDTLKNFGIIRVSNSNKTSIEQELTNYEQQLKEMEEARKALQESKDRDWIAKQDSDLAKKSERIKNQIENAKKQSTYKTYSIDIYELIQFRVNAIKYWYSNNDSLKNAIANVLPHMVELLAILIPITIMAIVLIAALAILYVHNKQKIFKKQIEMLKEEFDEKNIHFDIKM